jgi:hypothetical protein
LAEHEAAPHARAACLGSCKRGITLLFLWAPFLSSQWNFGREEICQGRAAVWRGLRTLDRFSAFWKVGCEGKGAGVSGGLPPGRV